MASPQQLGAWVHWAALLDTPMGVRIEISVFSSPRLARWPIGNAYRHRTFRPECLSSAVKFFEYLMAGNSIDCDVASQVFDFSAENVRRGPPGSLPGSCLSSRPSNHPVLRGRPLRERWAQAVGRGGGEGAGGLHASCWPMGAGERMAALCAPARPAHHWPQNCSGSSSGVSLNYPRVRGVALRAVGTRLHARLHAHHLSPLPLPPPNRAAPPFLGGPPSPPTHFSPVSARYRRFGTFPGRFPARAHRNTVTRHKFFRGGTFLEGRRV